MKIRYQLALAFGLLMGVAVLILAVLTYGVSRSALEKNILREQAFDAKQVAQSIQNRQAAVMDDLRVLADTPPIQGHLRAQANGGIDPVDNASLQNLSNRVESIFHALLRNHPEYLQIRFIDETGQELVRVNSDGGAPSTAAPGDLQNVSGEGFFVETMKLSDGTVHVTPMRLNRERGQIQVPHRPTVRFATPLFSAAGQRKGVVVLNLHAQILLDRVQTAVGNAYLVDQDGYFLKHPDPSRAFGFDLGHAFKIEQTHPGLVAPLKERDELAELAAANAAAGIPDRVRGFVKVPFDPQNRALYWAVVFDLTAAEAFAPLNQLRQTFLMYGLLILAVGVLAGFVWAGQFARPIVGLAGAAERIGEGDLTTKVPEHRRQDEIGMLLRSFHLMVGNTRELTGEIQESTNVLASSASEILAATTQVAAGAAETATAVSETTTTVEEVKQTAQVSSQKARLLSENAQKAAQVAQSGRQAVEGSIEGMERIQEQMGSIAEMVVKLSEQSQAIGEIVATVTDLAEQSNLLAVNAAIEAARAGEQGKGFAVVAQEVKSLADQSKQATTQVRTILNDIQKAISGAVMATEQGSKTVDSGVRQSTDAGEAIRVLAETIDTAAEAAMQIAASSQQQSVGMDQVAAAMENIKTASAQNVAGTKQAELAARGLHEVGQKLNQLVQRYKV
jgi:methyl-accepting chemotaxis protein